MAVNFDKPCWLKPGSRHKLTTMPVALATGTAVNPRSGEPPSYKSAFPACLLARKSYTGPFKGTTVAENFHTLTAKDSKIDRTVLVGLKYGNSSGSDGATAVDTSDDGHDYDNGNEDADVNQYSE